MNRGHWSEREEGEGEFKLASIDNSLNEQRHGESGEGRERSWRRQAHIHCMAGKWVPWLSIYSNGRKWGSSQLRYISATCLFWTLILRWFDEDSETFKWRLTTWQGRQALKTIIHWDLSDILRIMGLGAENDWVYLVISHREDFVGKKRSHEIKGGVLEGVLGWLW